MKLYSIRIPKEQKHLKEEESPFSHSSPLCQEMPYFFYRYGVVSRYVDEKSDSVYLGFLSPEDQKAFAKALNEEAHVLFNGAVELKAYEKPGEVAESLVRLPYEA
jgi:hypothetical protein